MGLVVTLGSSLSLAVREDADFGRVSADLKLATGGHYGTPRVLSVDRSEMRTLKLPVVIRGSGWDEVAAKVEAINTALARANVLTVKDSAGTNTVTFRTLPSPGIEVDAKRSASWGVLTADLEVNVEPYALGAQQTLRNAATTLPGTIDLSAMQGSYEAPLEVAVTLADMTQVVLGLLEEPYSAWTGWLIDANDLSWDTGGNASDGNAAGGVARKATNGAKMGAAVNVTGFPRGEYALWIRARMSSGTALLWSSTIGSAAAVTVSNTAYRWHYLGRLVCPTRHTYGSGTATTSVFIDPADTADAWLDRIAFVRASAGYLAYDGPACDSFAHDGQHAYVDGRTDYENVRGSALYALRGKLCALVERNGGSASWNPTVTVKAVPRTSLWR